MQAIIVEFTSCAQGTDLVLHWQWPWSDHPRIRPEVLTIMASLKVRFVAVHAAHAGALVDPPRGGVVSTRQELARPRTNPADGMRSSSRRGTSCLDPICRSRRWPHGPRDACARPVFATKWGEADPQPPSMAPSRCATTTRFRPDDNTCRSSMVRLRRRCGRRHCARGIRILRGTFGPPSRTVAASPPRHSPSSSIMLQYSWQRRLHPWRFSVSWLAATPP